MKRGQLDLRIGVQREDSKRHRCVMTQGQALRIRRQAIFILNNLKRDFPESSPIVECAKNIYNNANQLADYMKAHK